MALFPMFVNLKGKNVLIIGGGQVAFRKIEKILPFKPNLKVVAKGFSPQVKSYLEQNSIPFEEREFRFTDLDGVDIVIVAVDDIPLQKEIFQYTRDKKIMVNSVDSPDYCDFIFPAYVKREDVVIGITTSGEAPGLSAKLRKYIQQCLPENLEDILNQVKNLRNSLPKGEERQKRIIQLVERLFPRK
ncbi:MAG: bifunctional precorrin-2 dehydrogenase/sirohydrochlorin ferrochelatase [Aquificae bacterium]|nr:bifunctional precorrin-2 dehydrogenase/sirohydrochlorin ferrochelatase [Aquificota bacterium]